MSVGTNKVALISGANKGIGFETARQLAQQGFTVLLGSRDQARGEAAAKKLADEGLDVRPVRLNVTDPGDIEAAAKQIELDFGKLDVLINNAGVMHEGDWSKSRADSADLKLLRETFETNLFAVVAVTQALLPLLRKSDAGRIVNVSSILGSLTMNATPGSPIYGAQTFAYNASKAALNMYTVQLALALKDTKIKVNSAHPGWVKTDLGTDSAPMEVEDGAKTEVALATLGSDGPSGGYIHMGETLPW